MNPISLNIFVVEDNPFYQEMVTSYLQDLGHTTRGFTTGEEFLKHLNSKPDLVILDHNLESELQGDDVLRRIKSEQSQIPVIYISGDEKVSLVSDAYKFGSMEFIGKDSASLLRLKLALEKIEQKKVLELEVKKTKTNTRLAFLIGAAVISSFCLLFLLFN